ncbi:enterotoxin [bacterium]|nr:MAG: enterotoxin [bacterium]
MKNRCLLPLIAGALLIPLFPAQAVDFPGKAPGKARAKQTNGVYTLSNSVVSLSWRAQGGTLSLVSARDGLNGATVTGVREPFRLNTTAAIANTNAQDGVYLGFRWDDKMLTVLWGDGKSWRTLQSLPRAQFLGEPTLVRVGKMSLKADGSDYPEVGEAGKTRIEEISVANAGAPALFPSPRAGTKLQVQGSGISIEAGANTTAYAQWPLAAGTHLVSARVWKDSDQGESWGPGLALRWPNGRFVMVNARAPLGEFSVSTPEGETLLKTPGSKSYDLSASQFRLEGAPRIVEGRDGQELVATLRHPLKPLSVEWHATLRNGANYVRQRFMVKATGEAGTLSRVEVVNFPVTGATQIGTVPGSPLATDSWFFGAELPMGENESSDGAQTSVPCNLPLQAGATYEFGSVAGVYGPGQLRRSVLNYVEHERARPSSPFLHYNCWYDLAQAVNATDLNVAIRDFDEEMTRKRGVAIDSYVIDDGWDDARNTFWGVDAKKFPQGFTPVMAELKARNSHLGMWISPLGGYGEAKMRTDNARKLGLVEGPELDLSYPPYYNWYRDRCLQMMREDGVNYFKWDKAGAGVTPHFLALLRLANELRHENPNVYINVTVGTWPSPFWLNHIDSTWRSGGDMGWAGVGNKREQWLTYRDQELYNRVVKPGPLYPLNSIMHHGISLGRKYQGGEVAVAGPDLKHDARLYFATGASLQELYLTPSLMTKEGWDEVAAGAKWSKANFDVLTDAHWIGGDPSKAEVYGYASWAPRKGIFALRNPSDKPQSIALDPQTVFELPSGAKSAFTLSSPYADQNYKSGQMRAGQTTTFSLQPFEVLVFEAKPQ